MQTHNNFYFLVQPHYSALTKYFTIFFRSLLKKTSCKHTICGFNSKIFPAIKANRWLLLKDCGAPNAFKDNTFNLPIFTVYYKNTALASAPRNLRGIIIKL